jgi:hypothetical protein
MSDGFTTCEKTPNRRALYQGTTSVVPQKLAMKGPGFSPCGPSFPTFSFPVLRLTISRLTVK